MPHDPEHKPMIDDDEVRARHESNRANWNEGALAYTHDIDATVDFIRAGKSNLAAVERANLGDPWQRASAPGAATPFTCSALQGKIRSHY